MVCAEEKSLRIEKKGFTLLMLLSRTIFFGIAKGPIYLLNSVAENPLPRCLGSMVDICPRQEHPSRMLEESPRCVGKGDGTGTGLLAAKSLIPLGGNHFWEPLDYYYLLNV